MPEALAQSRRALDEFEVEGLATVIPFHRAIVSDPPFIGDGEGFSVHTRWIETEWNNTVEPFTGDEPVEEHETTPRQKVVVEVGGRRLEVSLPGDLALGNGAAAANPGGGGVIRKKPKPRKRGGTTASAASSDAVTAPMQGTVVKVAVEEGQEVSAGDLVVVLEAMKWRTPSPPTRTAPSPGWPSKPVPRSPRARCSPRSSSQSAAPAPAASPRRSTAN